MTSQEISAMPVGVHRESRIWLERLRSTRAERDAALAQLHALLLRAARFEVDALVTILGRLDDFRGESRFTTWAYKFALRGRGEGAQASLAGT